MKYLFITLKIVNGEFHYYEKILHTTTDEHIHIAASDYAKGYYGDKSERDGDWWTFFGGGIAVKVDKVVELTEREHKLMNDVFYN